MSDSEKLVMCVLCREFTADVLYRGKIKSCGIRIHFGECCKEEILRVFKTVKKAGIAYMRICTITCNRYSQRLNSIDVVDVIGFVGPGNPGLN